MAIGNQSDNSWNDPWQWDGTANATTSAYKVRITFPDGYTTTDRAVARDHMQAMHNRANAARMALEQLSYWYVNLDDGYPPDPDEATDKAFKDAVFKWKSLGNLEEAAQKALARYDEVMARVQMRDWEPVS